MDQAQDTGQLVRLLSDLLIEIGEVEKRTEIKRQVLAEHKSYNADVLFDHLAKTNRHGLTLGDIRSFFLDNGLECEDADLIKLFKIFDYNRDGLIDRAEYKKSMISREQTFTDSGTVRAEEGVSDEIIISLLKIFDEEIGGAKSVEKRKNKLLQFYGHEYDKYLFQRLDKDRKGYIDVRDIYELISVYDPASTYSRASRILRRLDRDCDNKVDFKEWKLLFDDSPHALVPLSHAEVHDPYHRPQHAGAEQPSYKASHSPSQQPAPMTPANYGPGGRDEYYEASARPVSEVSYNITPVDNGSRQRPYRPSPHKTTSMSLAYSKSPHRYPRSPDRAKYSEHQQSSAQKSPAGSRQRATPTRSNRKTAGFDEAGGRGEVVYEDKITVIDKSPDRMEKRTYISKKFADGSDEIEERIYEPLSHRDHATKAPYHLHREINERSPLHDRNASFGRNGPLREDLREATGESTQTGGARVKYTKTSEVHHFDANGPNGVSPLKHIRRQEQARLPEDRVPFESPASYTIVEEVGPEPLEEVRHHYAYGPEKERIVYSPSKYAEEGAFRREEIKKRTANDYDYTNRYEPEDDKNLQEEIVTHHTYDRNSNVQSNTYIRKIYSPPKQYPPPPPLPPVPQVVSDLVYEHDKKFYTPDRMMMGTESSAKKKLTVVEEELAMPKRHREYGSDRYQIADTKEYVELVRRESEKFRLRDELANKLSPDVKFSNLSSSERTELINCLKTKISLHREVEHARCDLAQQEAFGVIELFKLLKSHKENVGVTLEEFKGLFKALNLRMDEKLIKLIFLRNDCDNDGHLNFFEFSELMAPFKPELRQEQNRRRDYGYSSVDGYNSRIQQCLVRVLAALADYERATDETREVTQHRMYSLFNIVDQSGKSLLVLQDLVDVLERHGIAPREDELIALVRKFDANLDGKISLVEFISEMSPLRDSKPFEMIRNKGF